MTIKTLALLSIYLCAGLCCPREEIDEEFVIDQGFVKHTVNPAGEKIASSDTLWVEGRISRMVYRPLKKDSILRNYPPTTGLNVFHFRTPTQDTNCDPALSKMQIIEITGKITSDTGNCTSGIGIELKEDGQFYRYKIGLVPTQAGDYTLKIWSNDTITNSDLHRNIAAKYPLPNQMQIGYNNCGSIGWNDVNRKGDYSFTRL